MSPRGLGKDGQAEEFWVFSCWIRVCLCSTGPLLISTISIECLFWTRLFTRLRATVGSGHPGWFLEVCQLGFLFTELGIFHLPSRSIFISLFWKADHITGSLAVWHLVGLSRWPTGESSETERWVRLEVWILLDCLPPPRKPQILLNHLSLSSAVLTIWGTLPLGFRVLSYCTIPSAFLTSTLLNKTF